MQDEIRKRIDQLYKEMKPLQDLYGIKSKTINERYEDYKKKKELLSNMPRPRFKLPKL